jgi:anti-anti-sigma factor
VSRAIEDARRADRDVVVDLSQATYLDSSMLAALVGASERDRRRSEALVVLVETPRLRRSFEVKGLQTILQVAGSREQALELVTRHAEPPDHQA